MNALSFLLGGPRQCRVKHGAVVFGKLYHDGIILSKYVGRAENHEVGSRRVPGGEASGAVAGIRTLRQTVVKQVRAGFTTLFTTLCTSLITAGDPERRGRWSCETKEEGRIKPLAGNPPLKASGSGGLHQRTDPPLKASGFGGLHADTCDESLEGIDDEVAAQRKARRRRSIKYARKQIAFRLRNASGQTNKCCRIKKLTRCK